VSLTLDTVLHDAMSLPESDRWHLVEALLGSLEQEPDDCADLWRAEIRHRWAEYKAGTMAAYSWEEVKEYARKQSPTNG
jgi:putative addiction module component (TIGR02574 family)